MALESLLGADDGAPAYLSFRQQVADDDALRALREIGAYGQQPASPALPQPSPTAEPQGPQPAPAPGVAAQVGNAALAVGKDAVRGVVEAMPQAGAGAAAGVNETVRAVSDFATWLSGFLGLPDATPDAAGHLPSPQLLPQAPEAKSVTGGLVRAATQFAVGWATGGRELKALGWLKDAGPAGVRWLRGTVQGGLANAQAFDTQQARLADLWQQMNLPRTALTDYLASDPADTDAEARFKMFLDGALPTALADGVLAGVKILRSVRKATPAEGTATAAADPLAEMKAKYGEVKTEDWGILGDPDNDLLVTYGAAPWETRTVQTAQAAAGEKLARGEVAAENAAGAPGQVGNVLRYGDVGTGDVPRVFINWARIQGPDDVRIAMQQMADAAASGIRAAARGVQPNEVTQQLADDLGLSVETLLARRQGQAFNAEEATAARRLWAESANTLVALARQASSANAGAVDQFAFRRMLAVHNAIQAEVLGARAEAGRALQAWSIPAGGGVEQARAVQMALDGFGGAKTAQEMAVRLSMLADAGASPAALSQFALKGGTATTVDAIKEVWINGLLSSPHTHIVNMTSNLLVAGQQIYERKVAELISAGAPGGVAPGEAAAMAYGTIGALSDAFRLSWKALKMGDTPAEVAGAGANKIDQAEVIPALSAKAFDLDEAGAVGRVVDVLGSTFRVPGRLLMAEDAFFKTIGYRAELRAQALRQATSEGKQGPALSARVQELIDAPPENLRIASADAALYATFTNQTGSWGKGFQSLRTNIPPLAFVLPFLKTPVNIVRYSMERTPFAPVVKQWRDDINAGGARRDVALARMSTGTAVMAMASDWAASGMVTGGPPKDASEAADWQRQGIQPYSVRVGDRWYSYNRADPFGMTMGFAADIVQMTQKYDLGADDIGGADEVMAMALAAVSMTTLNKTYLQGMAEFTDMLHDPERYSAQYVQQFLASFVPFSSLSGAIERAADPTARDVNDLWDAVASRIVGLSSNLPAKRDLWGEPITTASGLGAAYDFLSPVASRQAVDSPIDRELARLDYYPSKIDKKLSWDGVPIDLRQWPRVYEEYVRLAGNAAKNPAWNLGARDVLDQAVQGQGPLGQAYQALSTDYQRQTFIGSVIETYRGAARAQIAADPQFGDFRLAIAQARQKQIEERRGTPQTAGPAPSTNSVNTRLPTLAGGGP